MFSRSLVGASRLGSHIYAALVVILVSLLITGLIAGCGAGSPTSTSTPVPTHTPTPTLVLHPYANCDTRYYPGADTHPYHRTHSHIPAYSYSNGCPYCPARLSRAQGPQLPTRTTSLVFPYPTPRDWEAEFWAGPQAAEPLVIATAPEGFPALLPAGKVSPGNRHSGGSGRGV